MAKYLDNDGLLYLWQKIKNLFASKSDLDTKVDKVTGKGLSTNDYTTAEKDKLNGIQGGAQVNPRVGVDEHNREILGYFLDNDHGVLVMTHSDTSPEGGMITIPLASAAQEAIESLSAALLEKLTPKTEKGSVQMITPRLKKTNLPHLGRHQLTP